MYRVESEESVSGLLYGRFNRNQQSMCVYFNRVTLLLRCSGSGDGTYKWFVAAVVSVRLSGSSATHSILIHRYICIFLTACKS